MREVSDLPTLSLFPWGYAPILGAQPRHLNSKYRWGGAGTEHQTAQPERRYLIQTKFCQSANLVD